MPFPGLLLAARLVQRNFLYRGRIAEIGNRRIIESDVPVFTETDKSEMNRRFVKQPWNSVRFRPPDPRRRLPDNAFSADEPSLQGAS